tara:strand:+ start:282 stop:446 length:165 start_codon:yes stop_codon:yes gene_type:complete
MIKLELNEIMYIHKIISEQDIKGADAPFISNMINKLVTEHEKVKKIEEESTNKK